MIRDAVKEKTGPPLSVLGFYVAEHNKIINNKNHLVFTRFKN